MSVELTGLAGRVAIVTGAGRMRSIGRPIAIELARAGCDVVVTGSGRPPERYPDDEKAVGWRDIDSVADEIRALGRKALPLVSDIGDEQAVDALIARTVAEFGRIDFLVNNAAAARGPDRVAVVEMPTEEWDKVIRVNLRGTFLASRAFARKLIAQGSGGAIINISSVAGKMLPARATAYGASKAGIQALSAGMAGELGPHNIRVNTICPGLIDTYRMDDIPRASAQWSAVLERIPLRRPGAGEDIALMTVYLCSDQGSWISGQAYNVDGGMVVAH